MQCFFLRFSKFTQIFRAFGASYMSQNFRAYGAIYLLLTMIFTHKFDENQKLTGFGAFLDVWKRLPAAGANFLMFLNTEITFSF